MKNIIQKFKNWLIRKLGGVPADRIKLLFAASCEAHITILNKWRKAVQKICRRSENSYYDWCCEYCEMTCDKRDGWCERFDPFVAAENEVTGCGSSADV